MEITEVTFGDVVKFGSYPQSRSADGNGFLEEPIEWLVLDVDSESHEALLISKYALDCKNYNDSWEPTTWAECSLRKWINGDFLNDAFDKKERLGIVERLVPAHKNPKYGTKPGEATTDKIFLLSIEEAEKYFKSDKEGACKSTEYAKSRGAYVVTWYDGDCCWWLRSPGINQSSAAVVSRSGSVNRYGRYVTDSSNAVRPALWVSLEALFPEN